MKMHLRLGSSAFVYGWEHSYVRKNSSLNFFDSYELSWDTHKSSPPVIDPAMPFSLLQEEFKVNTECSWIL